MMTKKYGWKKDKIDKRDYKFIHSLNLDLLPQKVDLRPKCPGVYDQGRLGSCTANAIAGALQFDRIKDKLPVFTPSRLFIYFNERAIEGTVDEDAGAEIRDGIKSVATKGAPPEPLWTYSDDGIKFKKNPPANVWAESAKHKAVAYQRLDGTLAQFKACLASGYPFVFGFIVYSGFESKEVSKSGILNFPNFNTEQVLGGHAVLAVGYDDTTQCFIVRNSWGSAWGQFGYFTIPYNYLTGIDDKKQPLADDFWKITITK